MVDRPQDRVNVKFVMKDKWPHVPLNDAGDPAFRSLQEVHDLFTDEEITTLVNKALYKLKYEREHHQKKYVPKTPERRVPSMEIADLAKDILTTQNRWRKEHPE